jgi:hypothetical protein
MAGLVKRIVIAGGGTAGWLSACRLAAWSKAESGSLGITLIEAPDIPTIGVGEGTWPTMRDTLAEIGIDEAEFLSGADASFKQGSRFDDWRGKDPGKSYFHPFTPPPPVRHSRQLVSAWKQLPDRSFASAMTAQEAVAQANLAPRQSSMPAYSGALNYAYHLDAGKFVKLLRRHAVQRLGVVHVEERIEAIEADPTGDIGAVLTASGNRIDGDLFIDCTGHAALMIHGHCGSPWVDRSANLFNDRALAVQVAVEPGSPIASQTVATAHEAGWIWDIGLPTRRGIGCVYSSKFLDDARAEQILSSYIAKRLPNGGPVHPRRLVFPSGHRERLWVRNCVAIGLSAGFVEPLEASAIVLIELSLRALIDNFPTNRDAMTLVADRFNELFSTRWERIVEFLKLHYVLSDRPEPYWRAHRDRATFPARLEDLLALWHEQPPSVYDLPLAEEIFPAASYQYVYYGMGGEVPRDLRPAGSQLTAQLQAIAQRSRALLAALPANRTYLDGLEGRLGRTSEDRV